MLFNMPSNLNELSNYDDIYYLRSVNITRGNRWDKTNRMLKSLQGLQDLRMAVPINYTRKNPNNSLIPGTPKEHQRRINANVKVMNRHYPK